MNVYITMELLSKKGTLAGVKRHRFNPLSRLEEIFRQRRSKKRERELQLQLAIFSGGIKRMK